MHSLTNNLSILYLEASHTACAYVRLHAYIPPPPPHPHTLFVFASLVCIGKPPHSACAAYLLTFHSTPPAARPPLKRPRLIPSQLVEPQVSHGIKCHTSSVMRQASYVKSAIQPPLINVVKHIDPTKRRTTRWGRRTLTPPDP
jgi:hypothetical protein